jgi:hypothetical protein
VSFLDLEIAPSGGGVVIKPMMMKAAAAERRLLDFSGVFCFHLGYFILH